MSNLSTEQRNNIKDQAQDLHPEEWTNDVLPQLSNNEASIDNPPLTGNGTAMGGGEFGQLLEAADSDDIDWINENQIFITVSQGDPGT